MYFFFVSVGFIFSNYINIVTQAARASVCVGGGGETLSWAACTVANQRRARLGSGGGVLWRMSHAHTGLGDITGHRVLKLFPSISKVDQQGITDCLLVSVNCVWSQATVLFCGIYNFFASKPSDSLFSDVLSVFYSEDGTLLEWGFLIGFGWVYKHFFFFHFKRFVPPILFWCRLVTASIFIKILDVRFKASLVSL